ncbi:MAG TPA: type II toxin-antitoxin system RelE/ParE family toxin [Rhodanobacteraceae bacterium]|nr:type II toxin-antitoxin system RelE/ParE family toxin [Rhodanobacteraceae bacterium]
MSVPVIFRAAAQQDIAEACRWHEARQPKLGAAFIDEIGKVEQLISTNPELFASVRGQVRRAIMHRFPYAVFYVVRPEFVSVVAVLHHARHPDTWHGRN